MSSPPPMFERAPDLKIMGSTVGMSHSNLSVCFAEIRNVTYAAIADNSQVSIVEYDAKMENISWDTIHINYLKTDKPALISQACLVLPTARSLPLLVVATDQGVQIFDVRTTKMISSSVQVTVDSSEVWYKSARGITCSDCLILVGSYTGEIMQFFCNGETSISTKKALKEHTSPIMDLATCKYDEVTCSVDTSGLLIVWNKPMKGANHRIVTGQTVTAINVLRKQVIVGTATGTLLLYSIVNAELMSKVDAHSRPVTAVSVAPESAYMMSASEDGRFIIFKLHTRKPQAYQMNLSWANQFAKTALRSAQQKIDSVLDIQTETAGEATTSAIIIDETLISPVPQDSPEHEPQEPQQNTELFAIQDTGQDPETWGSAWGGMTTDPELVVNSEPNPIRDDEPHVTPLLDHSPSSNGSDSVDAHGSPHESPTKQTTDFKDVDLSERDKECDHSPITCEPLLPPHVDSTRDSFREYHHDDSLTVASSDIEVIRNIDAWSVSSSKLMSDNLPLSAISGKGEATAAMQAQLQMAEQRRQELKGANDALQKANAQLQQRIVVLNQQQTGLRKEVEDKKKECEDILEEGKKISDYSGKQSREIRRLKSEMSDFEKVKSERKRYKDEKSQAEETIQLQKEELNNLKSMIKALETSSEQIKKENMQSVASSEVVQKHIEVQEKRITELESELAISRAETSSLHETNMAFQVEMEHLHSAQWADRLAGERANEAATTVGEDLEEARRHIERLTSQLNDTQNRLDSVLQEQGSIAETIAQESFRSLNRHANAPLLEELNDLKAELQNEQLSVEESDKKARGARKEAEQHKHQLLLCEDKHAQSITMMRQEVDSYLKKSVAQETELNKLRQEHSTKEAKFAMTTRDYEAKLEKLHSELMAAGEESSSLRKRLKEFREDNERLVAELTESQKTKEIPVVQSFSPVPQQKTDTVRERKEEFFPAPSVPMAFSFANSGGAAQVELEALSNQYESSMKRIAHLENETKRSQQLESQLRQLQRELKELTHHYNQLLELDGERLEKLEEQAQDIIDLRNLLKEQLIAFADAKAREEKEAQQ